MRTVVTRFRKGSSHDDDPDKSYVIAVVQHQFRDDSRFEEKSFDCSVDKPKCFQKVHIEIMSAVQGKLKDINDQLTLEISMANNQIDTSPIKREYIHFYQNIPLFIFPKAILNNFE